MSGYRLLRTPMLVDPTGKPVGFVGADGQEYFLPRFDAGMQSLVKPDGTLLSGGGAGYSLPVATAAVLGGVKQGTNISIAADGTISSTASGGGSYTLPPATATVLGGIKVGANLSVTADGTLSASAGGGAGTGSARVVYTSSTCTSDADVSLGSANLGTDQGAKLQAILDMAAAGPLHVIWDGAYGVSQQFSDIALKIRSNTVITVLPNCGLILRGSAEVALIGNYDRTDGRAGIGTNGTGNKNIAILGGMWNGNGVSFRVFQFFGVDQLLLRDNKLYNSRHFHFHCGNVTNLAIENPYVDKGNGGGIFGDGLHVCGPASNVMIRNATILNCGDDNVAFNADDAWVGNTETYQPRGPISNVVVSGVYMQSQLYGIRVLSGGSRVDNVLIERVRGSTTGYCLVVDNFIPAQTALTGPGNIGTLTLRDFDVEVVSGGGDPNLKAGAVIDCKVERLTIQGFRRSTFLTSEYASIQWGSKADIGQLIVDGYEGYPYKAGSVLTGQLNFVSGSKVAYAKISNGMFHSPSAVNGYPITVQAGATIGQLVGSGNQGTNFTDFVQNNGTVSKYHFPLESNFMDSSASTWTLEQGFSEVSDSALTYTGSTTTPSPAVQVARKTAVDSFSGNIQLSTVVQFTGSTSTALNAALLIRGLNLQPYSGGSRSAYVLDFNQPAGQVTLQRSNNSGDTIIGARVTVSGGIAMNTQYKLTAAAKGSTISARVQRVSDSLYLQPNGTWAAAAVDCASGTDTTYGSGSGLQYGVYAYVLNFNQSATGINYTGFNAIAAP